MSDPVAEFLAREQNVLAGIEDDSLGTSPSPYANSTGRNDIADNGMFYVVEFFMSQTVFCFIHLSKLRNIKEALWALMLTSEMVCIECRIIG